MILLIHRMLIVDAITDENRIQYHTDSTGSSRTLLRYHPSGALIRITLIKVINRSGVPLPSPCITLPVVIPIVTNG
jgi:hypothetical protein